MFSYHGGLDWIELVNTELLNEGERLDTIAEETAFHTWISGLPHSTNQSLQLSHSDVPITHGGLLLLRSWFRECAMSIIEHRGVTNELRNIVNAKLANIQATPQLIETDHRLQVRWVPTLGVAESMELRFLWSFAEFLASGDVNRLKPCGSSDCIQFFYDTSKNNTRRWCRMETCGNQEKARRHYQKMKKKA